MKSKNKLIILTVSVLAVIALLTSCRAPNTVTSDTKYTLALITNLYPGADINSRSTLAISSDSTVSGNAWAALKDRKKSDDAVKYYVPADVVGSEKESYSDAFTKAAVKQLDLAVSGGAKLVVLTSDDFSGLYKTVKDSAKKYGDICFVVITVPGSELAEAGNLNAKTTSVVLDNAQFGYIFGYKAVKSGFAAPGYIGADNAASKAFITGLKEGVSAADGDPAKVVSVLTSSGPVDEIIRSDLEKLSGADLLIGDELTISYVAASGKKYASIFNDSSAEFSVTVNPEVLKAKLYEAIDGVDKINAGTVVKLTEADGIFKYEIDGGIEVPEISAAAAQ